jgi:hypothetical protein
VYLPAHITTISRIRAVRSLSLTSTRLTTNLSPAGDTHAISTPPHPHTRRRRCTSRHHRIPPGCPGRAHTPHIACHRIPPACPERGRLVVNRGEARSAHSVVHRRPGRMPRGMRRVIPTRRVLAITYAMSCDSRPPHTLTYLPACPAPSSHSACLPREGQTSS